MHLQKTIVLLILLLCINLKHDKTTIIHLVNLIQLV